MGKSRNSIIISGIIAAFILGSVSSVTLIEASPASDAALVAALNEIRDAILGITPTQTVTVQSLEGPPGADGEDGADGTNGTNGEDGTNGTNGEDGADGTNGTGLGTHEHTKKFVGPYTAKPCNDVNPTLSTVSHLVNPDVGIVTEAYFEEFAIEYPFLAYASINEPTLGEMVMFGGNFAPRNWALAEGQTLSISGNEELFSILLTQYGGDGRADFQLPDMRCFNGNPGPTWIISLSGTVPSRN